MLIEKHQYKYANNTDNNDFTIVFNSDIHKNILHNAIEYVLCTVIRIRNTFSSELERYVTLAFDKTSIFLVKYNVSFKEVR